MRKEASLGTPLGLSEPRGIDCPQVPRIGWRQDTRWENEPQPPEAEGTKLIEIDCVAFDAPRQDVRKKS